VNRIRQILNEATKMRHHSLRDLLWLTLAAGVCVGWWVDQRSVRERLVQKQEELEDSRVTIRKLQYRYDKATEILQQKRIPHPGWSDGLGEAHNHRDIHD
jgi:hypothetical protein